MEQISINQYAIIFCLIIFDFYVCRMKCYQNVYHVVKEQTYTVMNVKHPSVNYVMISGIDILKEGNIN